MKNTKNFILGIFILCILGTCSALRPKSSNKPIIPKQTPTNIPNIEYHPSFNYSNHSDDVYVKGYYRKNGTYVQSHTRSRPRR